MVYTNIVNYTQQAQGLRYTTFSQPYSNNKILLFMTSLFIFGQLEGTTPPFYPIDLHISTEATSNDQYRMAVSLSNKTRIEKLHFSQIIFDKADVESLRQYVIEAEFIDVPE